MTRNPPAIDGIYFSAGLWRTRRDRWLADRSEKRNNAFDEAQISIITNTLEVTELSARCVVNIAADNLLKFLRDGVYKNYYDLEADSQSGNGRPFPLMGGAVKVSSTRLYVDELIGFVGDAARNLYFGAVALSGTGVRFYGEYCLVLTKQTVSKIRQILDRNSYDLVNDPLQNRMKPEAGDNRIDVAWLSGKWDQDLNDIIIMKIAPQIDSEHRLVTPGSIAEGVLADEDFIEVHLEQTFGPTDLEEIRFAPEEQALASDIEGRLGVGHAGKIEEWIWFWRRQLVDVEVARAGLSRRVVTTAGRSRRWQ